MADDRFPVENTRDNFSAAVSKAAGISEISQDPAERRRQLLAYRDKVEKARADQEARLAKLTDAQRKIDAELAEFEREEAERIENERKEAARKQVEEIQARVADTKPNPKDAPRGTASPAGRTEGKKPVAAPEPARRSPRFDIHAAVRFGVAPDDIIMRARNISMTGALLATEPGLVAKHPIGSEHDVYVFLSAEPKKGIALRAQIVRHEPSSLAVDWSGDMDASFRIALMISSLEPE